MQEQTKTPKAINLVSKVDRWMAVFEEAVMALGVIAMAINTIVSVISRFFFDHSIAFAEELNSIFILLVTFAGIGYAARYGRHIRMSAIYDQFSLFSRKVLMSFITGFTGIVLLFLAWYAVVYIVNIYEKGRVYPALNIPVYISYLWVPVGFGITGIQYLFTFYMNISNKGSVYLSTDLREQDIEG